MNIESLQEERGHLVVLNGEADLSAVPSFQSIMREKIAENVTPLVVDFSNVTFVHTPIWAVLVEYYQHTTDTPAKFAIAGLRDRVEASFTIVRLDEFIPHYATVDEAFEALNS